MNSYYIILIIVIILAIILASHIYKLYKQNITFVKQPDIVLTGSNAPPAMPKI